MVPLNTLDPARFRLDPDIARSESLPAWAFGEQGFLDRELATIFANHWLRLPQRAGSELSDDHRSLADLVRRRGARAPVWFHRLVSAEVFAAETKPTRRGGR